MALKKMLNHVIFPFEPYQLKQKDIRKEEIGWLCRKDKTEIKDNLGVAKK